VIDEVERMGKLDNTLIIYIAGDNGNSAEGSLIGTPNEVASLQGIPVPVEDQLKYFYDAWGSDQTYPHMAVPWTWAFDTPFSWTKQIASHFGGTRQGMAISWPKVIKDKGGTQSVPPHDRYRADDLGSSRHTGAGRGGRHPAEANRGGQYDVHLRCEERERTLHTPHTVL
jgi:hypothetical protein